MNDSDLETQVKEVYARFGLAMYFAQVLEHGLVNALVVLDLIPSKRHLSRSAEEWSMVLDGFMDTHFEKTMGRLIAELRKVSAVPVDLEEQLRSALVRRNWLAHAYFRERAESFMSSKGREQMIVELEESRSLIKEADSTLEGLIEPLRRASGITDELLAQELERIAERVGSDLSE